MANSVRKLFFLLIVPLLFFGVKNVNAKGINLYTSNYDLVGSCTDCSRLSSWDKDFNNVRRVRFILDSKPILPNYAYSNGIEFSILSPYSPVSATCGLFVNGNYVSNNLTENINKSSVTSVEGGFYDTFFNYTNTRTYVSNNSTSSMFIECELNQAYVMNSVSFSQFFSNEGQDNTSAIQNSTDEIIKNNDKNTEKIQEELKKNQEETKKQTEEQQKTNETLTDDTIHGFGSEDFDEINKDSSGPISGLITMPLTLLNKFLNGFNGQCQSYSLPPLLGSVITFPCLNLESTLGSDIWSKIDGLICLFLIYEIAMMVVSWFEKVTSLQDTFGEQYVPRHSAAAEDYIPKHVERR